MPFQSELIKNATKIEFDGFLSDSIRKYGQMSSRDWTIDRSKNCYFREIYRATDPTDPGLINTGIYLFFWMGSFIVLEFREDGGGEIRGDGWTHWTLLDIRQTRNKSSDHLQLPDDVKKKLPEIIFDLKEALIAYKDCGLFSLRETNTATFDFSMIIEPEIYMVA